jgi:hypothetical protein
MFFAVSVAGSICIMFCKSGAGPEPILASPYFSSKPFKISLVVVPGGKSLPSPAKP